ncbi:GroES-like protein [Rhizodiscina lignyota]|uniref:GroES-like protein n=1 Tax=Rhizodiscina lignyota TaxID=1504668 RepID=A0A9P4IJV3_9PEZI|nr:GroES-like protein [Rhizodiscina lignyota]
MKAVVVTRNSPSEKTTISYDADHATPSPGPNELLIRVAASAIQPSDFLNASGNFPSTSFPRIPGRDFAGTVVEPSSSPLHGKQVFGTSGPVLSFTRDGAHAEYVVVDENAVAEVPKGVELKQAAVMGTPWTTACVVLSRAGAKEGETVMVFGAGGAVGSAVVQLAKGLFGCKVLTAGRGDKYDVDTVKYPDLTVAKELTSGKGPDVVVDTTGDLGLMGHGLKQLAKGGRLGVITTGSASGSKTTAQSIDFKDLYRLEHSIVGCNSVEHSASEMAAWLQKMGPRFEAGELKAPDVSRYTEAKLEDGVKAYEELGKGSRNKYVIVAE